MTEQEQLMDDLERDITKVIQDNRQKMYQRMSAEKPSNDGELKYMLRYYDSKQSLRTKVLKPEDGRTILSLAQDFIESKPEFDQETYWIFDRKYNLIYSQVK